MNLTTPEFPRGSYNPTPPFGALPFPRTSEAVDDTFVYNVTTPSDHPHNFASIYEEGVPRNITGLSRNEAFAAVATSFRLEDPVWGIIRNVYPFMVCVSDWNCPFLPCKNAACFLSHGK